MKWWASRTAQHKAVDSQRTHLGYAFLVVQWKLWWLCPACGYNARNMRALGSSNGRVSTLMPTGTYLSFEYTFTAQLQTPAGEEQLSP